jgi:hypothetical protein
MKPSSRGVGSVAITLAASACFAGHDRSGGESAGPDVTLPANVIPVPILTQQTDFTGGDVATLALLRYWQNATYANVPESALYAPR